jgi:glucose/mannose transport system permease protein
MATAVSDIQSVPVVKRKPVSLSRILVYVGLVLAAGYFLLPIYLLVITSFKPYTEVNIVTMWDLPTQPSLSGLQEAWKAVAPNFMNSVIITVPAAILSSLLGSMNGYIFAKWKFPGSNTIFILFLVGMFLPYQGILIPLVQTLMALGLYGHLSGLIAVHCIFGIPITALMFRSSFAGIPNELIDAGKIDGCGFFGLYKNILLPISWPAFAVVGIWQFTNIWNDYLIGVIVLSRPTLSPVNIAVKNLAGTYTTAWQIQMAGALIAALPTIIVYLALGKFFMQGLLSGSVKG